MIQYGQVKVKKMTAWKLLAKEWADSHVSKSWSIESFDGLKLYGEYFTQPIATHKWALIVHGYGGSCDKMSGVIKPYFERGYNILPPDCRAHGKSEGDFIGMGWYDRLDMVGWINKIVEIDSEAEILLFGVSMGGATVMMTRGESLPKNVKVIIEDCGYLSTWDEFSYQLKNLCKLPPFPVLYAANSVCKIRNKFRFKDGSAINQLKKGGVPILFIHGRADTYVPYSNMDILFKVACGEKDSLSVPDALHAISAVEHPDLYYQKVDGFLARHMK